VSSDIDRAVKAHAEQFDIPGHAVIGTALDGRIIYWSRHAEILFGWSRAEAIGQNVLVMIPSNLSAAQAEAIMESLRGGQPWSGDFLMRARDGKEFVARVSDIPVRDSRGELVGVVGVTQPGQA
jgi:PAS domain S-box-containing protein